MMRLERILLSVLCLSGWHIFSSCLLRQYHNISKPMTWTKAQAYCREAYTDLATVENAEEMNQLINTFSSTDDNYVWIGLYSTFDWRYSDEYNDTIRPGYDFCVLWDYHGKLWWDHPCSEKTTFICNNGTLQSPEFVHVAIKMNWSSAQTYCRENYIDLASGRKEAEMQEITSLVMEKYWVWTGLFVEPTSDWSDGSGSSFGYWYEEGYSIDLTSAACAAASLQTSGKWLLFPCETKLSVACYSVLKPEVFRLVVKLRIEPGDSSLDPNDPTVKADILKQLQNRLKESRLSGVTLKWREQPGGRVFT